VVGEVLELEVPKVAQVLMNVVVKAGEGQSELVEVLAQQVVMVLQAAKEQLSRHP
jgi:cellobiose-specific phosphotransferase system component IIA